ncbi:class I SAM-dependent methyltransferase [Pseudomaricurvus alkylphenolicus]|uniref:class I SAM-dependent methyltransferase n=1 Tax=Pseudomaricurvus alkylphenolicus TaxID=1306991 RepID=UPI0014242919|nr:class I SAM-dependent methyltransferase [Pseudomaricurvus alkylphenolicus]NIB43235.1 class I SAM-dependent methyltransferase [Pseudomaricurvus alkylphenolicus]
MNDVRNRETTVESISNYYSKLVAEHGNSIESVDWGGRATQRKRFEVLSEIDCLSGKTLLDVGCGLGDFYQYLLEHFSSIDFTGVDITPGMIDVCNYRFPEGQFRLRDVIANPPDQSFDYVFASGLFYLVHENPYSYLQQLVQRLFDLCEIGVAFNCLSNLAGGAEEREFYADPGMVLTLCQNISPYTVLRHDYMSNDFTVYIYRISRFEGNAP